MSLAIFLDDTKFLSKNTTRTILKAHDFLRIVEYLVSVEELYIKVSSGVDLIPDYGHEIC